MFRTTLSLFVALFAVGLFSAVASGTVINYALCSNNVAPTETESTSGTFYFTTLRSGSATVPSNSATDLAEGVTPVLVSGTKHSASASIGVLTDGVCGTNGNQASASYFAADNLASNDATLIMEIRIDLPAINSIGQVNAYCWNDASTPPPPAIRDGMKFNLYASDGTATGFSLTNVTSPGWSLIANVDCSTMFGGIQSGQYGVSVRSDANATGSLGNFRYFMFDIFYSQPPQGGNECGDFYQEIDIVAATPTPEPSTLALLAAGLAGLLCYAWRKRRCVPSQS